MGDENDEAVFARVLERLIDGIPQEMCYGDTLRAVCFTKKYGFIEFKLDLPKVVFRKTRIVNAGE